MEHTTIAVDRAKSVFQVAVSHRAGRVDEERRLTRERFLTFFAQQPPATVVFEACGSAHYWARQLQPFGHPYACCPRTTCVATSAATRRIARTPRGCWKRIGMRRFTRSR